MSRPILSTIAIALLAGALSPAQNVTHQLSLADLSSSLQTLVNKTRPGVVQIFATGYVPTEESEGSTSASLITKQNSTGSGVMLSSDGYIVTNAHVVRGARRIQVRLPAKRAEGATAGIEPESKLVEGKLTGMDRETDIAVIKIDRTDLPFLTLGDSDHVHQGELVMAFGNPLGLEGSVSMGIVSSTERHVHPEDRLAYIQTDAPINPGNSGGPLVDSQGFVVGINSFILTQSGGSEGIGFAIPSNIVKDIVGQIQKEGHVHRGRIGISPQNITPAIASGLGLPRDWGVVLADVLPGGPADQAGAKVGDVIVSLNGRMIHDARQIEADVYRHPMREKVKLVVLRGPDQLTIDVPVIDSVDDPERFADMVNPKDNLVNRLGILGIAIDKTLSALLPELRNAYGVVVAAGSTTDLSSGTGLQPGDVIYSVNNSPVTSVEALKKRLDEFTQGQQVVMQIQRSTRLMLITVELE